MRVEIINQPSAFVCSLPGRGKVCMLPGMPCPARFHWVAHMSGPVRTSLYSESRPEHVRFKKLFERKSKEFLPVYKYSSNSLNIQLEIGVVQHLITWSQRFYTRRLNLELLKRNRNGKTMQKYQWAPNGNKHLSGVPPCNAFTSCVVYLLSFHTHTIRSA